MKRASILPILSKRTAAIGTVRRSLHTQNACLPARSIVSVASRPQFKGYRDNNLKHFRSYATIPDKQWAQVIEKTGERRLSLLPGEYHTDENTALQYKEIPVPKPGPDEVLVNIKYSGVCHT
jgi:hypothetical protein